MRKIVFIILGLVLLPDIVFAETVCTDRPECWPKGSSNHEALLLIEKQRPIEKLMASKHADLVKLISTPISPDGQFFPDIGLVGALKRQQLAWLKYRTEECGLVGSLTGAGGTWPTTYAITCAVNLSEMRLTQIQSATICVKKMRKDKRAHEQNTCLQQLVLLANK